MNVQIDPSYKYTFSVPTIKFAISFFYSVVLFMCVCDVRVFFYFSLPFTRSHSVRMHVCVCVSSQHNIRRNEPNKPNRFRAFAPYIHAHIYVCVVQLITHVVVDNQNERREEKMKK